ncbi:hypothetical protein T484DRAFT_1936714 [Baffinella frigidus]|nr:hypothetical protein T484DRAFT_1936714 [Cryptophyta sp. CCMP2293]
MQGSLSALVLLIALSASQSCGASHSCGVAALPSLRGGSQPSTGAAQLPTQTEGVVVSPEQEAKTAEEMMKEQIDYWHTLSPEEQQTLLAGMSEAERHAALLFVAGGGKPAMTISAESVASWKALSEDERQTHLKTMDEEQKKALQDALDGKIDTPTLGDVAE